MTTPNDKFKVIETAPIFAYSPTGSYSSTSFKSVYVLKFKNPDTKSVIKTSGLLGCNNAKISETLPLPILISLTDFGYSWVQTSSPQKQWSNVSLSETGQYQTAVARDDYIYISSDFGSNWAQKQNDTSNNSLQKYWVNVAMTASGQYQSAVNNGNGYIYVSTDFGNTWTPSNSPQKSWRSASLSASGEYHTAVANNEYIYTSISSTGP